jgi:anhydro-N-acetylmuramic acid kinase
MIYRAIGIMSGSSLDGLDIAFVEFQEQAGKWSYEILETDCYAYSADWIHRLKNAVDLSAKEYQLLHTEYGHYIGTRVNKFIAQYNLQYKVALIASHGHTTFHLPAQKMTAQLGDGAAIASETQLPVVSDLRSLDVAFGGQGAPIVPIGEKLLMGDFNMFLNIGGIANISFNSEPYVAFDICPANRVLNMLANDTGVEYDNGGQIAAGGKINENLLEKLNRLDYYQQSFPKSLANDFGTDIIYPLLKNSGTDIPDLLRTFTEHITFQVKKAITGFKDFQQQTSVTKLLITGGGAHNVFLVKRLKEDLLDFRIEVLVPEKKLVEYKEALIMAFIGVLRWRQEYNVLSSVSGATRNSIGGALWTGQEA